MTAALNRRHLLTTGAAVATLAAMPAFGQSRGRGAITVKSAKLAGSSVNYAYAVKAGPWIFLNGHEGYDFERGPAPEVDGPPGNPMSGTPPLRREARYVLSRMGAALKDLGSDLKNVVRVDQFYTEGAAVSAYHLERFAAFGDYIPPSTSILTDRLFTTRTHTHVSALAVTPGDGWAITGIKRPGQALSSSGYFPAVTVNDFVFVAGNTAVAEGKLPDGVGVSPNANWGGQTAFRRQAHHIIKERLASALAAADSKLENALKAQVYIRGVENFPDFLDVWQAYFRDIPCALTLAPCSGLASKDALLEINLVALKNGATRRKQVVDLDVPAGAIYGPCVRAGELVFPSGFMALGKDGLVPAANHASAFDGINLAGQAQGDMVLRYAEAACKAVGVTAQNIVRAQYFLTDVRDFAGVAAAWAARFGDQPHPLDVVPVPGPLPPAGATVVGDFWIYAG